MPWATCDKIETDEWVQAIEDRTARFIGSEFDAASLIAYIVRQAETGQLEHERARILLNKAYNLKELAEMGHQAHKWLRKPPAQLVMLVLEREGTR